ncbi:hypothetical protein BGX27_002252, partial [Mortierella sp. AM989]
PQNVFVPTHIIQDFSSSPYLTRSTTKAEETSTERSTLAPPKRLQIPKFLFEKAKSQLLSQPDSGPVILARDVSLKAHSNYCSTHEDLPIRICLVDGNVIAYEISLRPHTAVAGRIHSLLARWDAGDDLAIGGDLDVVLEVNAILKPDLYIQPWRRPAPPQGQGADSIGNAFPTMIVEIATSQGLSGVHAKVAHWFPPRTTIQLCLIIKIWRPRGYNTLAMVVLRYHRTNNNPLIPTTAISFGTAALDHQALQVLQGVVAGNQVTGVGFCGVPCSEAAIPVYQMTLPAALIYNGDPQGVPEANALGFGLDLWDFQVQARRAYLLP